MKVKSSKIGGQAVLEGVMMRGEHAMATAVRDASDDILIESSRFGNNAKKSIWKRIPIIRGVVNFFSMMVVGIKTLMSSSEVYGEIEEPNKFEKWLAKKFKISIVDIAVTIGLILGVGIAIALFFVLPQFLSSLLFKVPAIDAIGAGWKNLIAGVIRLLIFVIYILCVSLVKDIKRVFRYHGAEHKTINCYESGEDLTVENVMKHSRIHNRCGTTFLFLVMIVSIILFSFLGWDNNLGIRLLTRLAMLPVVAGVSYELLKLLAKYDNWFVNLIRGPGLWLQYITTAEPDESMVEVAITAFKTVQDMEADPSIPERKFDIVYSYKMAIDKLNQNPNFSDIDKSDIDWIFVEVLNCSRSEIVLKQISTAEFDKIKTLVDERLTGKPLDYILGHKNFYGYEINVNENVLIPRPETELLVEQALKLIDENTKVLDLCSGSGAIAIAIAKEKNIKVYASDISLKAIEIAKISADKNNADVEFINSDLFDNIENKFDVIVSNPPYIKTDDINGLMTEVKDYEPKLALDGGVLGFDIYEKIILNLDKCLNNKGNLLLECGYDQAEELKNKLSDLFENIEIVKDYNGIDRIVLAKGYKK